MKRCAQRAYAWAYSTAYSVFSRAIHRLGFHYAPVKWGPPPHCHYAWCHWCGLRGEVITKEDADRFTQSSGGLSVGIGTRRP